MTPPPRARSVTPAPTIPPPLPDEPSAVKRVVAGMEPWQKLLAAALLVFAAGGTAYSLAASKADVAELHQVRDSAAAQLGAAQASTGAQLGTLQATVQDLRARQAAIDTSVTSLTADVARLNGTADRLYLQLVEIARATGARQVRDSDTKGTP